MRRTSNANTCHIVDCLIIGIRYEGGGGVSVENLRESINSCANTGP